MQAKREEEMAAYAAKQLADFVGSALQVLGKPETPRDKDSLLIPLDNKDEWSLDLSKIDPPADRSNSTRGAYYALRLHHMLGSDDYVDVTESVAIQQPHDDYWEVSDSSGTYGYQEVVSLTRLVVAGVQRYERHNDITSLFADGREIG